MKASTADGEKVDVVSFSLKLTPSKSSHRAAFTHRQKNNHLYGCRNILIPTLNISPKLILNDL